MKQQVTFASFVLIAVLGSLGIAPAVAAAPDPGLRLVVQRPVLVGGQSLRVVETSSASCNLYLKWNGQLRSAAGRRLLATFGTPVVQTKTRIALYGVCVPIGPTAA
jgi:hypothetical protein